MASNYYIKLQGETETGEVEVIFEGPLNCFKNKYYDPKRSANWSDEQILECARNWAKDNDWDFELEMCH